MGPAEHVADLGLAATREARAGQWATSPLYKPYTIHTEGDESMRKRMGGIS